MPRRATRPQSPPLTRIDEDTTAADFEEAMGYLLIEARHEYDEWQRLERLNYTSAANEHKARWATVHAHLDDKLECWQVFSGLEAHDA